MLNILEITCGTSVRIPDILPNLVHYLILFIQIFIPIVLIVLGMLDMGKAVMSNDEKVMKENQNKLIKRVIYAVLVFLVVAIVKTVVSMVANVSKDDSAAESGNISTCIECFVNGTESSKCK
ncbi:MAG: hypothetical protein J6G98_01010 [Bacilli bacterium]|nr:hypothetical protein [Bacilli bacterium]